MNRENVSPFHLFNHDGHRYMLDIENMRASCVDEMPVEDPETKAAGAEPRLPSGKRENPKRDPFPITTISLFLTQSCNLNCIYCYGGGGAYGTGGNMDEKTALQSVDWLIKQSGKMKKIHIDFLGGEPFLRFPLMQAVVEHAKKRTRDVGKDADFHCTTNATLLDDEQIEFVKRHDVSLTISFDGPREIQDAQRPYANGQGSYDSTVPKIKKVLAALPDTPVSAVVTGNADSGLIKNALREIGFKNISLVPFSPPLSQGEQSGRKLERNTRSLVDELEQEAETWIELIGSRDSDALNSLKSKSGLYKGLVSLLHNSKKRYPCGAGRGLAGVSASGDVYLCHRFVGKEEYRLGSVFGGRLDREQYQDSPATHNEICSACFARYYCAGGCKHDNLGSSGSISVPAVDICRLRCRELELAASVTSRLGSEDQAFLIEQGVFTPKPCPFDF